MNEILTWLVWGVGGLVLVAVVVAGWEHLAREVSGRRVDCGAAPDTAPRALAIDLRLDTQAAALAPEPAADTENTDAPNPPTDRQNRLAAMAQALSRAAGPGRGARERGPWMDTTPRIVDLNEPVLGQRDGQRESARDSPREGPREAARDRPREKGSSRAG